MRLKLFKKYFFATAMIIVFSMTVMMIILSIVMNQYFTRSKYDALRHCCEEVTAFTKTSAQTDDDLDQLCNSLARVAGIDLFLADEDGKVTACGCDEWRENGHCYHSDHILGEKSLFADHKRPFRIDTLGIYKNPHFVVEQTAVDAEGKTIGTVISTAPLSATRQLLSTVAKLYLFSAAIPLTLMFFAIYAMTYRMTKPLKLMSEAARAMAKGDFSKRIPVTSDDEIGELAVSFNQMTNSLAQLESMRKSFVANVSHELKTPMTTIGGFIDGILDGTIEQEKQSYYLGIVSDEIKRLSRLVQSMLSMAKLESGEFVLRPELFDFRELLCTIVISQEQRIEEKKITITGLDEVESVSIRADRDLIHQVLYNLVDNAIKFTEEKGNIDFAVKSDNKKLTFTIQNSGKGIPEKELPYVFERFYKVDKSRSANKNSTGLGLYIVKTILKAHAGTITVKSRENDFTAFIVTLPTVTK